MTPGAITVAPFAEPHVHLDRAFSSAVTGGNRSGTLPEAIERFLGSLERMTVETLAIVGHLTGEDDLEWLGRVITTGNRRICGLPAEPDPDDGGERLLIEAASLAEAVALVLPRRRLRPT